MLLNTGAELQDPSPLCLHSSFVRLQERKKHELLDFFQSPSNRQRPDCSLKSSAFLILTRENKKKEADLNSSPGWVVFAYKMFSFILHRLKHVLLFIQLPHQLLYEGQSIPDNEPHPDEKSLRRTNQTLQYGILFFWRCYCCDRSSRRQPPLPPSHSARWVPESPVTQSRAGFPGGSAALWNGPERNEDSERWNYRKQIQKNNRQGLITYQKYLILLL